MYFSEVRPVYSPVGRWLDNRRSPNSFHIRMRTNTYVTNPFIFGCFTYLGMALKSTLVDNPEVGHRPRPLLASVTLSLHLGNPQTSSLRCVFLRRLLVSLSFMLQSQIAVYWTLWVGPLLLGIFCEDFFPEAEDSPWYVSGPQVNTYLYGVLTFQYASYYNTGESPASALLD